MTVRQPKFNGPDKFTKLNPASMERLVVRGTAKTPNVSWLVYFYADWSDHCLQHDPMVAELSLQYVPPSEAQNAPRLHTLTLLVPQLGSLRTRSSSAKWT